MSTQIIESYCDLNALILNRCQTCKQYYFPPDGPYTVTDCQVVAEGRDKDGNHVSKLRLPDDDSEINLYFVDCDENPDSTAESYWVDDLGGALALYDCMDAVGLNTYLDRIKSMESMLLNDCSHNQVVAFKLDGSCEFVICDADDWDKGIVSDAMVLIDDHYYHHAAFELFQKEYCF